MHNKNIRNYGFLNINDQGIIFQGHILIESLGAGPPKPEPSEGNGPSFVNPVTSTLAKGQQETLKKTVCMLVPTEGSDAGDTAPEDERREFRSPFRGTSQPGAP